MNRKLLWGLTAFLMLTASACQNPAKPSDTAMQPAAGNSNGASDTVNSNPAQPTAPSVNDSAAQQPKDAAKPTEASPQPQPTPSPAEAPKKYRLNPKSYDILPIDPSVTEKKMVLLTFDDGPKDKEMLDSMLNTLDKHHAKAIFFVNGYRVKQKPELLKLIHERGQTIGNHSWDHIDLKKENQEKVNQQIGDVQAIVKEVIGEAPRFFRPPFGSGGDLVRAKVKEENMLFMTWSNGSKDWEMSNKSNNPDQVVANVLEQLRPGSNILMHELTWTDKALDKLLTELEQKQYGFIDPSSIEITP